MDEEKQKKGKNCLIYLYVYAYPNKAETFITIKALISAASHMIITYLWS